MKEFICEWVRLMMVSCLFFVVLAIIIVPTIVADKIIDNNSVSELFTFVWGFLNVTFFAAIAIREVKKKNE